MKGGRIRGNTIAATAANIVVDRAEKIIGLGFNINTHHHVWQTQLKGRHTSKLLLDYVYKGKDMA